MSEAPVVSTTTPTELLATGRRHLAVRDYTAATEVLAGACEALAAEHGDTADQCAEAYLWYGKALLGLSREESGVLGDGVPGSGNADEEDEGNEEGDENGDAENGKDENGKDEESEKVVTNGGAEKSEAESTTKDEEPAASSTKPEGEAEADAEAEQPGPSNGEVDESTAEDAEDENDVDNLQLAWEMLELSRSILEKRVTAGGGDAARAALADAHLALGEVALESETYDKAVVDMQSCLELQKELYRSDDRRIAETHYQIGLANSLASNFEDAITHFKNAANILETRIATLENPTAAKDDATVKKYSANDPFYTVDGEIKELKELLPEIREKIHDMMDYKAETIKRVRETLCPSNGDGASSSSNGGGIISSSSGASSSTAKPISNISHLIKRKRKSSEGAADEGSAAKRTNT
ncbi:nuclear autoantigenic sperm protein [Plutella xylostella]|uniref:nuclear autoantigenic sperm protein n=1 Tax=Plutella xylostella TaxID=51655 RepID=UPI0018D14891|nr:nuclear autoantigenic sperm protein [Plutella xylostella]